MSHTLQTKAAALGRGKTIVAVAVCRDKLGCRLNEEEEEEEEETGGREGGQECLE